MYDNTWKCAKIRQYFAPKYKNLRVLVVVVASHINMYGRSRSTDVVLEVVVVVVV